MLFAQPKFHVAIASPEIAPFAKTGGLGDVLSALPKALARLGVRVSLFMPAYRSALKAGFPLEDTGFRFNVPVSDRAEEAAVFRADAGNGIDVYLIRADRYFDRENLYGTPEGDYPDNAERFVFFCRAVLEALRRDPPNILHCHDWQSALAIAFLKAQPQAYQELSSARTVFTFHNAGYQGLFSPLDWGLLNLASSFFTPSYLEFYGNINFLKGALVFADALTTVSPTYAQEVQTPEKGFGLEGVFQEQAAKLSGILNGADYEVWNPETDLFIAKPYGSHTMRGKALCKADLRRTLGLRREAGIPLMGMVTRLAGQKGLDLLENGLGQLMERDVQLVILGAGDREYQDYFQDALGRHPGRAAIRVAFNETLAHKIVAGADMLLMPSQYEPCGLTQMYSLKYGTIPIVRATGGLKDTVQEFDPKRSTGTGFLFGPYDEHALLEAVDRALALFRRRPQWSRIMKNAMLAEFSWDQSARKHLELYESLLNKQR